MGFTTKQLKKQMTGAVLLWCMLHVGLPSLHYCCTVVCIPASYCHLSVTFQTMSSIVVNLQDNRAVFQIFIALLRFSFDSPSYIPGMLAAIEFQLFFSFFPNSLKITHSNSMTFPCIIETCTDHQVRMYVSADV
jgi:hypothetical protein